MRVLVTGATGFVGSAVIRELTQAGHDVVGLARNDGAAARLADRGVAVHRGDLNDPDSLAAGAALCDGAVHLAFIHDFTQYEAMAEVDRRAVAAMATALHGKPLVVTSGTLVLAPGDVGREADRAAPSGLAAPRGAGEEAVRQAADQGVRSSVVRLPPAVYGPDDHGFIPMMTGLAEQKGFSGYVGDGSNRWPAVHRSDAARLYRLALEGAPPGAVLHAAGDEALTLRQIAEAIADSTGLPARSIAPDEAVEHFGGLTHFATADNPVSAAWTRELVGWAPQECGLIEDIRTRRTPPKDGPQ